MYCTHQSTNVLRKFLKVKTNLGGIRSGDRHRGGACLGLEGVGVSANEAKDPCASGAARTSSDAARSGEGERGAPHAPASNVRPSGANVRIAGEDPRWLCWR